MGFSSWGCKELGTTEQLTRTHTRTLIGSSAGPESVCSTGDLGSIPGQEDPLEKEMATHSSILAWRIPWTEEPGGSIL